MNHATPQGIHFDRTRRPADRLTRWVLWLGPIGLLVLIALGGCEPSLESLRSESRYYVQPTVAVMSFQAHPSPVGWTVGDGLADVLTDELVKTGRFHVVERPGIGSVLGELGMQQGRLTRPEGRSQPGRLKNVEYLIKGRVTDFGHVSSDDGWARLDRLNVFGARHKAVLRMTFSVVQVESGQIVATRTVACSVRTGQTDFSATYKDVGFGGATFYRTPLGKATAGATERAVREIVAAIATRPWQPRIALVQGEQIILNGGADRGLRPGEFYRAHEFGEAIIDPGTGDVLGRMPGQQIGQIEVVEVHDRYAVARPTVRADYRAGQHLAAAGP